jgi:hypothetical protein
MPIGLHDAGHELDPVKAVHRTVIVASAGGVVPVKATCPIRAAAARLLAVLAALAEASISLTGNRVVYSTSA